MQDALSTGSAPALLEGPMTGSVKARVQRRLVRVQHGGMSSESVQKATLRQIVPKAGTILQQVRVNNSGP